MSAENMVRRLKPIDYGSLQKAVEERRNKAVTSAERVKQIQSASHAFKGKKVHKQHYTIWCQELMRLEHMEKRAMTTLDKYQLQSTLESESKVVFQDICKMQNDLDSDLTTFRQCVIDPVFALREDVKFYLQSRQKGETVNDPQPIRDIITKIKTELKSVEEQLFHDEKALLEEMEANPLSCMPPDDNIEGFDPLVHICTGIPEKAWDLPSPDEDLKVELLQQFIHMDTFHQEQWEHLQDKFHHIWIGKHPDGWNHSEALQFESLCESYTMFCMINRFTMLLDAAHKMFPRKTHQQVTNMEAWVSDKRVFSMQTKALLHDWSRSRQELADRIRVTLEEAMEKSQLEIRKQASLEQQLVLCQQLADKVTSWREQKIEMMTLEQKIIEEEAQKQKALEKAQSEKVQQAREKRRLSLNAYKAQQEAEEAARRKAEQERLAKLKEILEKQASYDRERVHYRERATQEKVENLEFKKWEEQQTLLDKERRLEELRQQVRPNIEKDPQRVFQPTKAWEVHTKKADDEEDEYLLTDWVTRFDLGHFAQGHRLHNTFTAQQVMADPRCRVENALREAGLINSEYARSVLKTIPSNQKPRRDNFLSTNGDFLKQVQE